MKGRKATRTKRIEVDTKVAAKECEGQKGDETSHRSRKVPSQRAKPRSKIWSRCGQRMLALPKAATIIQCLHSLMWRHAV
eukprot:scaffold6293_cov163-Ochromonas_danica.AAC.2